MIINQPRSVVWDFIPDPRNTASVLPGIVCVRAEKDPPYAIGDLWHGSARLFGRHYDWTGVFIQIVPGELMEFRSTESRFPFVMTDTLDEVPGGTCYTCRATGEQMIGGRLGGVTDGVVLRIYERALRRHLSRLPTHVDRWAAGVPPDQQ